MVIIQASSKSKEARYRENVQSKHYLFSIRSSSLRLVIILFHNCAKRADSFSLLEDTWKQRVI